MRHRVLSVRTERGNVVWGTGCGHWCVFDATTRGGWNVIVDEVEADDEGLMCCVCVKKAGSRNRCFVCHGNVDKAQAQAQGQAISG